MIAGLAPVAANWVGAILSTLLTILTAFNDKFNQGKVHKEGIELFKDIGQELANVRMANSSESQELKNFWSDYKMFQYRILLLKGERSPGDPMPQ
jgi:hypothetical protein